MLRRARNSLLVIVATALLAGCGSGDDATIPSGDSDNLINLLNAVEDAVADQDCDSAQDYAAEFVTAVNNLPSEVDNEVKEGLRTAGTRMTELSGDPGQCEPESGASDEAGAEETTPSTTVEEETTTEETTTEEPEQPAGGGGGNTGGDQGGGNTGQNPGGGGQTEIEIQPGTESGGIDPGERRTP